MLGEKAAEKTVRLYLRRLGYGAEDVLGWDSGEGFLTGSGRAWQGPMLLVATPNHLVVLDKRTGDGNALEWHELASCETRQDRWKTNFIVYTQDGASITLRTAGPRPVQTLIADWIQAGVKDEATTNRRMLTDYLKQQWESGAITIPMDSKVLDSSVDVSTLPGRPVATWSACPQCGKALVLFESMADCSGCRRIWCDGEVEPVLDRESGQLVGSRRRVPLLQSDFETGRWQQPAAFLRGPYKAGYSPPLPSESR